MGARHRIESRALGAVDLAVDPGLKPIHIPAGICGNSRSLSVAPVNAVLLKLPDGPEVLAHAGHLAEIPGPVRIARGKKHVTYIHLIFDAHQIIFANGALAECFCPVSGAPEAESDDSLAPAQAKASLPTTTGLRPRARHFLTRSEVLSQIDLRPGSRNRNRAA